MADATATTETSPNDVKIEDVGPARKRLTITIPPEAIAEKIDDSMDTLAAQTALPGFRKGRAPKALLQRRFGGAVREETKNQIIADAYSQAIEQQELKPVSDPEPTTPMEELSLEEGKELTFAVEIEVVPEFDLPSLDGIEVKKPMLEITDEHIETEIKRQCTNHGEHKEIEGNFEPGDQIACHASVVRKGEDEPFFQNDEVGIAFPDSADGGQGQVLGLLIDDLHKKLKDKRVGDTLELTTTVPEGHEREDIRGKEVVITLQLRKAQRVIPAEVETVVQAYGMESEDILREQIKMALEQRLQQDQANAMREQVYEQLAESVDFELPEKLSASQADRIVKQAEMDMLYRGMNEDDVEEQLARVRAESMSIAQRKLKLLFLMHRLAEKFEIEVSEQEINGRIAAMAAQRGMRPEQLRNDLAQANRLNEVGMMIRDHKTADRIIGQAKVEEVSPEQWQKIVDEKRGQTGTEASTKKKTTKKKTSKKKTTKKAGSTEASTTKKKTTKKKKSS